MDIPNHFDLPCAWRGDELVKKTELWTIKLTPDNVKEIANAAKHFTSTGQEISHISRDTFPLPEFGSQLDSLRHELQHGLGFKLISGLPIEDLSMETLSIIFCGIGSYLGSARSQNAQGHILGHVKDVGADLNDNNVRIYQTAKRQTFHTDSCDAVGLLCLKQAKEGGDSLLAATLTLYNEVMKQRPDLAPYLFKPIATDRRGEVPEGKKPYFMIPVLNWHKGNLTGLYQRTYINSASRFDDAPVPEQAHLGALDLLDEIANDPSIHLHMRLQPGDMQFVYNHTNLHDRTAFIDWPNIDQRRHLLRLWLALPDDRELPPVFAERYGSIKVGDRGGIIVSGTQLTVPDAPTPAPRACPTG